MISLLKRIFPFHPLWYLFSFIMGILVALGIIFVSCSPALKNTAPTEITQSDLSWESELNPFEFDKWELVQITKEDSQSVHYIAKNPDENSPIYFVSLVFGKEENHILEYYYFKDGEPHAFIYYDELDKYKERIMPRWRKERCFKCHKKTEV